MLATTPRSAPNGITPPKSDHARRVHYTTDPVIISHESTSEKKAEKPIQHDSYDESMFRSWQENNLVNPG